MVKKTELVKRAEINLPHPSQLWRDDALSLLYDLDQLHVNGGQDLSVPQLATLTRGSMI